MFVEDPITVCGFFFLFEPNLINFQKQFFTIEYFLFNADLTDLPFHLQLKRLLLQTEHVDTFFPQQTFFFLHFLVSTKM